MNRLSSESDLFNIFDEGDDGGGAATAGGGDKKRRLSAEQVRALERSFEVEDKLVPERKAKLAAELGLHPRQVAVWFQNRRARWKTKQLERDFAALRGRYDQLQADYDSLHLDTQSLHAQIKALKRKLGIEESLSVSVKEELGASESESKPFIAADDDEPPVVLIHKDGSSESDSSAVLNDDNSPSSLIFQLNFQQQDQCLLKTGIFYQPAGGQKLLNCGASDDFLADEEPCSSFFSDEQPPSLSWYCPGELS